MRCCCVLALAVQDQLRQVNNELQQKQQLALEMSEEVASAQVRIRVSGFQGWGVCLPCISNGLMHWGLGVCCTVVA